MFEIEAAGPGSASLAFAPLQRRIRGRWDLRDNPTIEAGKLFSRWPESIPGQRLALDAEARTGAVIEPLYEPASAALRQKVAAAGFSLPPEQETFSGIDPATWSFWMQRAVDAGLARVVSGQPPKVTGKPKLLFVLNERADPRDRTVKSLIAMLFARMTPKEREAYEEALATLTD